MGHPLRRRLAELQAIDVSAPPRSLDDARPIPRRLLVSLMTTSALVSGTGATAQTVLPQGGTVVAGSAVIASDGVGNATVTQNSARAIVNWDSFSVGQGNSVHFDLPSAAAAILNRVTGSTTSQIAGTITGNGQVYLVNANGIAITASGSVDVGGVFVASTLDIADEDFLSGKLNFRSNSMSGLVSNAGTLSVGSGGFAALLGGRVANTGLISVPLGRIGLGSGEAATLDFTGDGFLQLALPSGATGSDPLVAAAGHIAGARIVVRASTLADKVRAAVVVAGALSAQGAHREGGEIVVDAGEGSALVTGQIDATGLDPTANGGTIMVGGNSITLEGAQLNATGTNGGRIMIGGGEQGHPVPGLTTASTLHIDAGTRIDASGAHDGGDVTLWSDEDTLFAGRIIATGITGNGGNAEVSGRRKLTYEGLTDLRTRDGATGTLLLDPYNVTISSGADTGTSGFAANATGATINTATLQTALASANVTVSTGVSGSEAGDITVSAPLSWSANTTLTLNAAGAIVVNAGMTGSGATSGLTLTAAGAGGVSGSGAITNSGVLTVNVNNATATGTLSGVISGSGSLTKAGAGTLTLSNSNTYTGATNVSTGTINLSGTLPNTGNLIIASGATLNLTGAAGTYNRINWAAAPSWTIAGTLSNQQGTGAVAQGLPTTVYLNGGTITGTGTTTDTYGDFHIPNPTTIIATGSATMAGLIKSNSTLTLSPTGAGDTILVSGTLADSTSAMSLTKSGSGLATLTGANIYTGTTTVNAGTLQVGNGGATGTLGNGSITVSSNGTLAFNRSNTLTVTNFFSVSAGRVAQIGSGTLISSGFGGNLQGALDISGGTLQINSSSILNVLGAGSVPVTISNNAALVFNRASSDTTNPIGNLIQGSGSVSQIGTGAITMSNSGNSYSGGTTVASGTTIIVSADKVFGNGPVVVNGTVDLAGKSIVIGSLSGSGKVTNSTASALPSTLTVGTLSTVTVFNGNLQDGIGALALTKVGTGTLTLKGSNNTYTGGVNLNTGILALGSATALGSIGTISFGGGTLQYSTSNTADYSSRFATTAGQPRSIDTNLQDVNFTSALGGSGSSLTKLGGGTLTLTATNGFTGATTVYAGTLKAGNINALANSSVIMSGGTLDTNGLNVNIRSLSGTSGIVTNSTGAATLIINNSSGPATYSGTLLDGSGTLSIQSIGANTQTLAGNNSYSGTTSVSNGTLKAGSAKAFGTVAKLSVTSTIDLNGYNISASSLSGTGTVTTTGGNAQLTFTNLPVTGLAVPTVLADGTSGTGVLSLDLASPYRLTLTGANLFTGNMTGTNGAFTIGGAGSLNNGSYAGDIGLSLQFSSSSTQTLSGTITGNLTKDVSSSSTLIVLGNNAANFTTTIGTGTLQVGNGGANGGLGTGAIQISGSGALTFNRNNALTVSNVITADTGTSLNQAGTGTTTLTGLDGNFNGTINISGGTLEVRTTSPSNPLGQGAVNVILSNNAALALNRADSFTVANIIRGTGSVRQDGSGTVTLSNSNTYSGITTVTNGILKAGSGSAFGNSNNAMIVGPAGMLDLAGRNFTFGELSGAGIVTSSSPGLVTITTGTSNTDKIFSGSLQNGSGTLALTKAGSGKLTLSGANSYTGATAINGGMLIAASTTALGNSIAAPVFVNNSATLDLAGYSLAVGPLTGQGIIKSSTTAATLTVGVTDTVTMFDGVIQDGGGAVGLTKTGTGMLTLTGANSYSGDTVINGGILQIGNGGTTGTLGTGAVKNFAQLRFGRADALTVANAVSGSGELFNIGTGTLTLSGLNTYTGRTSVNAGKLKAGSTSAFGSNSTVAVDTVATLDLSGISNSIGALTGEGTVTTTGGNATLTFTNVKASDGIQIVTNTLTDGANGERLSLGMANSGRIMFGGTNTFTGDLIDRGGNGSFGVTAGSRLNGGNYPGTIGTPFFYEGSADQILSGNLSGIRIQKYVGPSTLTLTGNNGQLTLSIETGVVRLGSSTALGDQSFIEFNSKLGGGTLQYGVSSQVYAPFFSSADNQQVRIDTNGLDISFPSALASSGGTLTKLGQGTLTLSGINTYSGATNVTAGTLNIAGSWTPSGNLATTVAASGATLSGSGVITASTLAHSGFGTLSLTGANALDRVAVSGNIGAFALNNSRSFSTASIPSSSSISLTTTPGSGASLTLEAGASLSSPAPGTAITLAADATFINNAASGALSAPNGRWLVYAASPGTSTFNGLDSANPALWNVANGASVTATGNRYAFARQPVATFSVADLSKTYGTDASRTLASSYVVTGIEQSVPGVYQAGAALAYSGTPALTSSGAAANATVGNGPYAISIALGDITPLNGYAVATGRQGQLFVAPAPLTITGATTGTTYNALVQTNGFTVSGLFGSDTVVGVAGLASGTNAGTYADTLSNATGSGLGNYAISYVDGTLAIARAPLTLTGMNTVATYNGQARSNAGAVLGGVQGSDSFTITGYARGTAAGTYADSLGVIANGPTLLSNYDLAIAQGGLAIAPAPLTITGATTNTTYNALVQTNGFTASGLFGSDTVVGVAGLASGTNAGTYADALSNATGSGLGNYAISYVDGTLAIARAPLTLTGMNTVATYNGQARSNAGAVLGGVQGSDSFTITGYARGTAAGTYADSLGVIANGPTLLSNYDLAIAQGGLAIAPAPLTITGATTNTTYNALVQTNGFTASGLFGSDTVVGVAGLASGTNAGTYADALSNATGSGLGNYAISYVDGTLAIARAPLTLTGMNTVATYNGQARSNAGAVLGGVQGSDSFTITGYARGTAAGTYADSLGVIANGPTLLSNYDLAIAQGGLAIAPAPLTITGATTNTTYNALVQTNGFTVSGLFGSDTVVGVAGLASGTNAGTYADTLSNATGSGLGNYAISYVDGTLAIARAPLTLIYTASAVRSVYGASLAPLSGAVSGSGFVGSEGLGNLSGSVLWSTTASARSGVGSYAITGGGLANSNYVVTPVQAAGNAQAYDIEPASLVITANNAAHRYDATAFTGGNGVTLAGLIGGDTLANLTGTLTFGGTAQGATDVGTYQITASGLTNGNYTIAWAPGNLVITPIDVLVLPSRFQQRPIPAWQSGNIEIDLSDHESRAFCRAMPASLVNESLRASCPVH